MRTKSLLFLLLLVTSTAFAQVSGVSPYSRFGIGDPAGNTFATGFGMGGLNIGFVDRVHINPTNAALLPYINTPGLEVGLIGANEVYTTTTNELTDGYSRLDHFSLGLPMGQGKWGASLGMRPYTVRSFSGSQTNYIPELDVDNTIEYEGEGGLNRANVSLARRLRIVKDTSIFGNHSYVSIGLTMNYYFGNQGLTRNSTFPNNSGFHNTRAINITTVSDVDFSASLALRQMVNKKTSKDDLSYSIANVGLVFEPGGNLSSKQSQRVASFVGTSGEFEVGRDSIFDNGAIKGNVGLPSFIGLGASMEFYFREVDGSSRRKLVVGADYHTTAWTELNSQFAGITDSFTNLQDASSTIVGIQYTPDISLQFGERGNVFTNGSYRMGARLADTHLSVGGQSITEYGMSFGASFPVLQGGIKRSDTEISLGMEYGKRGTTNDGLVEETFTRFMVGFVFHPSRFDRWFQKRKYD